MVHADLIIRQAVPADAADIKALILMAMDVYARNSGIHTPLDAQLETLADHRAHIRADHVLVVEHHGRLIGTVRLVRGEAGTAFFSRFAVLPALLRRIPVPSCTCSNLLIIRFSGVLLVLSFREARY